MSDTEDITTETANTVGGAAIYNASSTVTKRFAEHLAEKKASVHFHAFPLVWMIFFIRKKRKKKKKSGNEFITTDSEKTCTNSSLKQHHCHSSPPKPDSNTTQPKPDSITIPPKPDSNTTHPKADSITIPPQPDSKCETKPNGEKKYRDVTKWKENYIREFSELYDQDKHGKGMGVCYEILIFEILEVK